MQAIPSLCGEAEDVRNREQSRSGVEARTFFLSCADEEPQAPAR